MEIEGNLRRWRWGAAAGLEEICGAGEMGRTRHGVSLEWDGLGEAFREEQFRVMTRSGPAMELEFLNTLNSWIVPPLVPFRE